MFSMCLTELYKMSVWQTIQTLNKEDTPTPRIAANNMHAQLK